MKITVYIPVHNYGKYVDKAVGSVLKQTMTDWEIIIINDGSTDNTSGIIKKYENHPKIRVIEQVKKGLNVTANIALRLSNADYFMRLDADDYLDENALLVLSNTLDAKPEAGLVYPDYYLVDEKGEVIEIVRRKKIAEEAELLDLPAHGACTMFRRECLLELGGYEEDFDCQDGYELWLRFLRSFKPYNVNIPLFYYRQHQGSLTKDQRKIFETRGRIKRKFVDKHKNGEIPGVIAIIPVIKQARSSPEHAFTKLAGKYLIDYTLREVLETKMIKSVVVTSNDTKVLKYVSEIKGVISVKRPPNLTSSHTRLKAIVNHVVEEVGNTGNFKPDAAMILFINAPLRKTAHIEKAIDTMAIFDVDTVVSVEEELAYCYFHDKNGLVPVQRSRDLRIEKKAIYKENGAILLANLKEKIDKNLFGKKVGHVVMLPEESVKIKSAYDLWQAEKIISDWRK